MSKVVFVGNVPYNMGEDQLIDVFKSVGQVVGFRLVFDRDTGKPRGYGFCEFADHETAASAVRNLNNTDVGGRPLRIDLADSDPFLEGKTTVRGELIDGGIPGPGERERDRYYGHGGGHGGGGGSSGGGHERGGGGGGGGGGGSGGGAFMANLPPGIPVPMGATSLDTISQTLATMNPGQLMEVLAQMKAFVITHPEKARALLVAHPQLAYALFQALLLNEIVDPAILQRMLAATSLSNPPPKPTPTPSVPPPQHQHPYTNPPFPPPPTQSPYQQSLPFQPQRPNPPPPPPISSQSQNLPPHIGMNLGMGMSHLSAYPSPSPSSHGGLSHTHMGPPPPSMIPPASAMFSHQQQQQQQQQGGGLPGPYGYRPSLPPQQQQQQGSTQPQPQQGQQQQPQGAGAPADVSAIDPAQRAMLMQVLSMTPDQISALPPTEREAIQVLRNQFMGGIAT